MELPHDNCVCDECGGPATTCGTRFVQGEDGKILSRVRLHGCDGHPVETVIVDKNGVEHRAADSPLNARINAQ